MRPKHARRWRVTRSPPGRIPPIWPTGGSDCKQNTQPGRWRTPSVSYQTTIGYSLISSGLVTLLLAYLPGDSLWWGIGLLLLGIAVFFLRR